MQYGVHVYWQGLSEIDCFKRPSFSKILSKDFEILCDGENARYYCGAADCVEFLLYYGGPYLLVQHFTVGRRTFREAPYVYAVLLSSRNEECNRKDIKWCWQDHLNSNLFGLFKQQKNKDSRSTVFWGIPNF
ncbi:uncharacterized protein LOC117641478 [Thrips palmi]|uniref:Uncharacterized protein LOC117641478 n=1 Tax=Thrips palmi TaxID=161013 RepID=A0A6P8ZJ49_THRPL|nr:uncharacterized protein LOC117641478 [Thrips palmi]